MININRRPLILAGTELRGVDIFAMQQRVHHRDIGDIGRCAMDVVRKLPRQAVTLKVELSACWLRYWTGVIPPSESWDRSSL
ncbi:hypothetical protein NX08_000480 [Xanthomonas vasicola]|nr:hypothetical protein NX08_000480 [Xanthomonas vasicola]